MSLHIEQTCLVAGCDRTRRTRDWCQAHYNQWRTTGEVPTVPFTDEGRFYKYAASAGPGSAP